MYLHVLPGRVFDVPQDRGSHLSAFDGLGFPSQAIVATFRLDSEVTALPPVEFEIEKVQKKLIGMVRDLASKNRSYRIPWVCDASGSARQLLEKPGSFDSFGRDRDSPSSLAKFGWYVELARRRLALG